MALQELNREEITKLLAVEQQNLSVLVTTPFCGTCQVAEKMLDIVQQTGAIYPVGKVDGNYIPEILEQWQVTSVPCLVLIRNGIMEQKVYAMHSAPYLYELLSAK